MFAGAKAGANYGQSRKNIRYDGYKPLLLS